MSEAFEKFSSKENLKLAYKYVKKSLETTDLQIFPINNPGITAIDKLGDIFFSALQNYIRSGNYQPTKPFYVYFPKDNLGLRPVCALSTIDRVVYQALFNKDILGHQIDSKLSGICFGNRVENIKKNDFLKYYIQPWNEFHDSQKKAFRDKFVWRIEIDIKGFFENISIEKLQQILEEDFFVEQEVSKFIHTILKNWTEGDINLGIPQGPQASWVIANAYLDRLDKHITTEYPNENIQYFRYADDMVIMGKSEADALHLVEEIALFLRQDSLSLNEKTQIHLIGAEEELDEFMFSASESQIPYENNIESKLITVRKAEEIVDHINAKRSEHVTKRDMQELRRFLNNYRSNVFPDFPENCVRAISQKPSILPHLIRFTGSQLDKMREEEKEVVIFEDQKRTTLFSHSNILLEEIFKILKNEKSYKWLKVWTQRLLVGTIQPEDKVFNKFKKYSDEVLSSSKNIQAITLSLLFQHKNGIETNTQAFKQVLERFSSSYEYSLVGFFVFNISKNRDELLKKVLIDLYKSECPEANLIAHFLSLNTNPVSHSDKSKFSFYLTNPDKEVVSEEVQQKNKVWTSDDGRFDIYQNLGVKQREKSVSLKTIRMSQNFDDKKGQQYFVSINNIRTFIPLQDKKMWRRLYKLIEEGYLDCDEDANFSTNVYEGSNLLQKEVIRIVGHAVSIVKQENKRFVIKDGIKVKIVDFSKVYLRKNN